MASKNREINLLFAFWERLKHALSDSDEDWVSSRSTRSQAAGQDISRTTFRHLERCLMRDCPVEAARKQLERFWWNSASS